MNPLLDRLVPYPFERLRELLRGATPPAHLSHISMSIGEPRHPPPAFILDALADSIGTLGSYPLVAGLGALREAAAGWLSRRFSLPADAVDPERMVLPVNGTREALFALAQAVVDASAAPVVAMPNPFYQIYEGAALLAGAEPLYLDTPRELGYLPDLDAVPAATWRRCQLLYLCTPGNPTGAVMNRDYLAHALGLAEQHDFVIASDECYADIYLEESVPPPSLLETALATGRDGFERCIVFHSLSKRSSVPGLRSGFVAGDASILERFRLYRTYHGCAMPTHTQLASIPAWNDDEHAAANRRLYQRKFREVLPILEPVLEFDPPVAGFYLWPLVYDDERFTRQLFANKHLTVLPGSYLGRDGARGNPGRGRVRISLVAGVEECVEAAERIRDFVEDEGVMIRG